MNATPGMGHNQPPDPIEAALAPHDDAIHEAGNWLDGESVTNADQLSAVDALAQKVKAAEKAIKKQRDAATAPMHAAWQAEIARWKPTLDDLDRIKRGLANIAGDYRKQLAAEKEAVRQAAQAEARRKEAAARAKAAASNAGDIDAQRDAAVAKAEAEAARKAVSDANKDTVKGLRTVHKFAVDDRRAALNWIATNDPDALAEFVAEYARKHHRTAVIAGVRSWEEKEPY